MEENLNFFLSIETKNTICKIQTNLNWKIFVLAKSKKVETGKSKTKTGNPQIRTYKAGALKAGTWKTRTPKTRNWTTRIFKTTEPYFIKGIEKENLSEAAASRRVALKYLFTKSQKQLGKPSWTNLVLLLSRSLC